VSLFKVKVTWTDFVSLAFIRHFLAIIEFRVSVIAICVAIAGFSCAVRTTVSSAKVAVVLSAVVGRPAVYRREEGTQYAFLWHAR